MSVSSWTQLVSVQTHRVRADTGVRLRGRECLPPGNFITDATMRPSHGRLSGHHPAVRYRPRDNRGWIPYQVFQEMNQR
jgi:hypothetical protein